jgi:hypothetical protein
VCATKSIGSDQIKYDGCVDNIKISEKLLDSLLRLPSR